MEHDRLPHIAMFSALYDVRQRAKRGRPPLRWKDYASADLKVLGIEEEEWEASCQIRFAWRTRLGADASRAGKHAAAAAIWKDGKA
jgi:hypothetical protein